MAMERERKRRGYIYIYIYSIIEWNLQCFCFFYSSFILLKPDRSYRKNPGPSNHLPLDLDPQRFLLGTLSSGPQLPTAVNFPKLTMASKPLGPRVWGVNMYEPFVYQHVNCFTNFKMMHWAKYKSFDPKPWRISTSHKDSGWLKACSVHHRVKAARWSHPHEPRIRDTTNRRTQQIDMNIYTSIYTQYVLYIHIFI